MKWVIAVFGTKRTQSAARKSQQERAIAPFDYNTENKKREGRNVVVFDF